MWDPEHVWQRQGMPGNRPRSVLWGTYGSCSLTPRGAARGPTAGTKAEQAELAVGSTTISAPSALHLHLVGTLEDVIWPMFRCQTPPARADTCCPSRALRSCSVTQNLAAWSRCPCFGRAEQLTEMRRAGLRTASLAGTSTKGSRITPGEVLHGDSLEKAACIQLCHTAHDFTPCAPVL